MQFCKRLRKWFRNVIANKIHISFINPSNLAIFSMRKTRNRLQNSTIAQHLFAIIHTNNAVCQ